ncbi:MAG: 3-hydroxyacyl-CoA dehydrogenase NAD-binding domain-containing protein [Oligoflexia bacterium]
MADRAFVLERVEGAIWSLVFDAPGEKVNTLGREVMEELRTLLPVLKERGQAGEIEALILKSGKQGQFIAGADIQMIAGVTQEDEARKLSQLGQDLFNEWEDLPFPTVAAVQGPALGGGCEWALASSAIVLSDDSFTRIGLPEVMLGILPGIGGCVRLPRKVGLAEALDLILTGKQLKPEKALKSGLVEAVLPASQFMPATVAWLRKNLEALRQARRLARAPRLGGMGGALGRMLDSTALGRALILRQARNGVLAKTRGKYPAPLEVLSVLSRTGAKYGPERLTGTRRKEALAIEAAAFGRLAVSPESKSLVHVFFLMEQVKKARLGDGRPVLSAAVLGAGVMGGGIAQLFADRGTPVRMKDLTEQALTTGVRQATQVWQKQVLKKRLAQREFQQRLNLISPVLDYSGFGSVDLVVEAVVEKMDVKRAVFRELEEVVADSCIIASNTSSLSVSQMQKGMRSPERFAGMHFFNPVSKMPLVEVIRGAESSSEAVATVYAYCRKVGKTPIVVKDAPGFLVNRLLAPYLNEATYLVADGAPIEELDRAILEFGMPMGPIELIDEIGIDVGEKVSNILFEAFGPRMKGCDLSAAMVASGRLGKKNGKGFYLYENGRKSGLDPEVESLLGSTLRIRPKKRSFSGQEMIERCIFPMINEASRALNEAVVESAGEVDLGMIMGTGFPPFRGGLLRYADQLGIGRVSERLAHFSKTMGTRFEPSEVLLDMASKGHTFVERFGRGY